VSDLTQLAPEWEQRLNQLVNDLDVPGAAVGVCDNGERVILTAGIESLRSGHPVISDTAFQIGSISKVFTTTLLAAVTELDDALLNKPVAEAVPEAKWMDPEIKVVHLLTHSSGLAGDCFADTGRGDDALSRYVTQLEGLPNDVPGAPGRRYSYCNSGFAVLGRLIEVLTGGTYDAALSKHLLVPLGLGGTTLLPEETVLKPHAIGHNRFPGKPLKPDDIWHFARAADPMGGICATPGDLLSFAEMHLANGIAKDGTEIIPMRVAQKLRERRLETPEYARPSARGLGWGIYNSNQGQTVGHDGETLGQVARLRIVPEHGLAYTILTNAIPDGHLIARELETAILKHWDIALTAVPLGTVEVFDPEPYLGRYRNFEGLMEVTVAEQGHGLKLRNSVETEGLWEQEYHSELVPIGGGAFVDAADSDPASAQRFDDIDASGRCQSYFNGRVFWRVDD
jgi:CubicO group peptidase (beta-lactamase class C family)